MSDNGHYSPDIITTEDEEGKIHLFEKVDELELEGQRYALLIYQGSGEDLEETSPEDEGYDEEIVVMRVTNDGESDVFEAIEDEDEFERVVSYIEQMGEEEEKDAEE